MATKKSSSRETDPQEIYVSRSEKKRQAKNIEEIAKELMALSPAHIKKLPADDLLKTELHNFRDLKGPALKRQIKYIASMLRESGTDDILAFLAERKGSHLKQTGEFHELERLREDIITEVLAAREEAWHNHEHLTESWQSETIAAAGRRFPALDLDALKKSALRYAATRKPVHRRELFRQLHAAMERQQFSENSPSTTED
ncbi:MAG: ribosome biogenesis factor YjgA [Desulfurivibrionaceae bacterium]|jgi:ribosome-associated protein